jgi:hypothetical protein
MSQAVLRARVRRFSSRGRYGLPIQAPRKVCCPIRHILASNSRLGNIQPQERKLDPCRRRPRSVSRRVKRMSMPLSLEHTRSRPFLVCDASVSELRICGTDEDERERLTKEPVSAAPAAIVTSQPEPVDEQVYTKPASNTPTSIDASPPGPVERKHVSAASTSIFTSLPEPVEPGRLAENPASPTPATLVTSQPESVDEQAYGKLVSATPAILVASQPELVDEQVCTKPVSAASATIATSQLESVDEQSCTKPDEASLFTRPEPQGRIGWLLPKFSQGSHRPSEIPQSAVDTSPQPSVVMPPRRQHWGPPGARPIVQNKAWQARFNGLFKRTSITAETPSQRIGQLSVMQPAELNPPPPPLPAGETRRRFGQPSVVQPAELHSPPPHSLPDTTYLTLGKYPTGLKRPRDSLYHGRDSWLHLETILTTIGAKNAGLISHLRLKVPKWYPNASADALAGALIDAAAPGARTASFINHAEDRLLSAVSTCTRMVATSDNLKSLYINMTDPEIATFLNIHQEQWGGVLSAQEEDSHEKRREAGVRLLRAMSDAPGTSCRPQLVISGKGSQKKIKHLSAVVKEAERYGWDVSCVAVAQAPPKKKRVRSRK